MTVSNEQEVIRDQRYVVSLSEDELRLFESAARRCGMTTESYIRKLAMEELDRINGEKQ